jgi:hypothetical protein
MAEARELYEKSVAGTPEVRQTLLGFARLEIEAVHHQQRNEECGSYQRDGSDSAHVCISKSATAKIKPGH